MSNHVSSFLRRFRALTDKSALILIVPCAVALMFIDETMAATLLQWIVFAPILAGVAIIVSRISFPQIELTRLVRETYIGNRAAAILASAVVLFVGLLVMALVIWAKA